MGIRRFISVSLFLLALSGSAAEIPTRPLGFIADPQSVLPLTLSKGLSRVLEEHENLSRESVFVVVSQEKDEDEERRAAELFDAWKRDTREPTSAVLLYVQLLERKAVVKAGIGMEAFLSQFPLERVTRDVIRGELHSEAYAPSPGRAVVLSVLEVLRSLESPLVRNGEAQQTLREAGFEGEFIPRKPPNPIPLWPVVLAGGMLGFLYIIGVALSGEAHYSGEGWVRVRRWIPGWMERLGRRRNRGPRLVTGGGVSGTY